MHQDILYAIKNSTHIPTMPSVPLRFLQMSAEPECDFDDLVDLLGSDPGITSELLKLSNSALFGSSRKISSLKQAMVMLGLRKIKSLVLSRYLVTRVNQLECRAINMPYFWRRSISTAALAAGLCEALRISDPEEAFVAGLLADIGVVVLDATVPETYRKIGLEYQPLHSDEWVAREFHALGIGHAEVSSMVLQEWQLPEHVVQAVRCHHPCPGETFADGPQTELTCVVAVASQLAQLLYECPHIDHARKLIDRASAQTKLPKTIFVDALSSVGEDIVDLARLLKVSLVRANSGTRLREQLVRHPGILEGEC